MVMEKTIKQLNDEAMSKINLDIASKLYNFIQYERQRQNRKFPSQERQNAVSLDKWMVILGEEVGELFKASLEQDYDLACKEAVEVCAVVQRILEIVPEFKKRMLDGSVSKMLQERRDRTFPAKGHE